MLLRLGMFSLLFGLSNGAPKVFSTKYGKTCRKIVEIDFLNWISDNWLQLGGEDPLDTKREEKDVLGIGISVARKEREELKKKDKKTYYKVRENCVKGIENKFTQLKSIDENSPIEHFESIYSVVTRFDDL